MRAPRDMVLEKQPTLFLGTCGSGRTAYGRGNERVHATLPPRSTLQMANEPGTHDQKRCPAREGSDDTLATRHCGRPWLHRHPTYRVTCLSHTGYSAVAVCHVTRSLVAFDWLWCTARADTPHCRNLRQDTTQRRCHHTPHIHTYCTLPHPTPNI